MFLRWSRPIGLLIPAFVLAIGGCGGNPPATQPASVTPAEEKKPDLNLPVHGSAEKMPPAATQIGTPPTGATASDVAPQARGAIVPPPQLQPILVDSKIVTDKYPDGTLKRQVKVNVYTGVPERYEGEYKEWHPNGKLWKQGMYKDGLREGPWKFWHENGTLAKSGDYKADQMEGAWTCLHDDGTKSREENWRNGRRDGVWKIYDDKGSRVVQQQQYRQNTPDGTWTTWHPNGQKATEEVYLEGQRHGTQSSWYVDGKQRVTVEFRNGRQHGKMIQWNSAGKKISERNFRDGEQVDN